MKKLLQSLFILCFTFFTAAAQDRTISGTVTSSEDGLPIPGTSVTIKEVPKSGVATDANGKFTIKVPANGKTLQFTSVGFATRVVAINGTTVNVALSSDSKALDEVMVVAYGTAKRSTYTGSVSTVKSETIENRTLTSVTKALDGAAPGVTATMGSGQPGSNASIVIRGFGSINASSNPLYVVDGVPFDGDLNSINPNDVESLSVLKDASAASLYGSRAANGVVMITTKSGKNSQGKVKVNVKANVGVASRAIARYDVMNTQEYIETAFLAYKNDEIFAKGTTEAQAGINALNRMKGTVDPIFGVNEQYNPYDMALSQLIDPVTGKINSNAKLKWNDNWMDAVTAKNPMRQEYQLDASGGTDKMKTMLSLNSTQEEGLLETTKYNRITGRANTEVTPVDWFKASLSANFTKGKSNMLSSTGSSTSNVWYSAEQIAPIYPIYVRNAADGQFVLDAQGNKQFDYGANRASGAQQNFNSIATLFEDKYLEDRDNFGTRTGVEFNTRDSKYGALSGFALALNLGADYVGRQYTYYYNPYFGNAAGSGRLNKEWTKTMSYTFNQLLTWNRSFNKHSVDVLLGHENYKYTYNLLSAQKTGFPFGGLYELAPGSSIADANSYENNEALESYFTRVQYSYAGKYFLNASARTDGSSRFFVDNRWGKFWSVGGAWKASDEDFMKNINWLNSLTVKSSYGEQGNNSVGLYAWQAFYDLTWNNATNNGGSVTSVENKNVSWEKNKNFNIGFESRLLKNRMTFGFDWFERKTTDMLLNRPLALSTGFDGFNDNVGSMQNNGFDITLGYDVLKSKDLTWNITAMASKVNNKVLSLTDQQTQIVSGNTIIRVGETVNSFYMPRSAGVDPGTGAQLYWVYDNAADEFDRSKHYVSGDKSKASSSRVLLGSRIPTISGSLSTSLNYKKFDLSIMTTYSLGGKILDNVGNSYSNNNLYIGNNFTRDVLRAWKQPGDVTDIPRVQKEATNTIVDRALVDATYFSIRNFSLGYTFDVKAMNLSAVRVFVQGDNIATFSARQGLNPQYNFSGTTDYVYTPNRVISAGLNVKF